MRPTMPSSKGMECPPLLGGGGGGGGGFAGGVTAPPRWATNDMASACPNMAPVPSSTFCAARRGGAGELWEDAIKLMGAICDLVTPLYSNADRDGGEGGVAAVNGSSSSAPAVVQPAAGGQDV